MIILSLTVLLFSLFVPFICYNYIRLFSLFSFILVFILVLYLFLFFNKSVIGYQFYYITNYQWYFFNIIYLLGYDAFSLLLILLSSFLMLFCLLVYWFVRYKVSFYTFTLASSLFFLIIVFLSYDFFIFFIFFEAIVIPIYFLIAVWGSRTRKILASYLFFFYTLFGSVLMLIAFLDLYLNTGSSSFIVFDLPISVYDDRKLFLWLLLFFGLSVKIPIIPFHIWLPEAHVEAPTPGSVLLAGILLKLGSYAMLRFLVLGQFFFLLFDLIFLVFIIGLFGFIYSSLVALNQIDLKKIIAYASIAHMNFSLFGLFGHLLIGVSGAFIMMLGHAITSAALFISVGNLYDRYKTRLIFYYGGLTMVMPLFSCFVFVFFLSNFGFPGTINFVGEFLISVSGFAIINTIMFFANFGLIISLFYSLFLYNKVFFGPLKVHFIRYFCDCTRLEFFIFLSFCALIIFFGLYPNFILNLYSLDLLQFYQYNL